MTDRWGEIMRRFLSAIISVVAIAAVVMYLTKTKKDQIVMPTVREAGTGGS